MLPDHGCHKAKLVSVTQARGPFVKAQRCMPACAVHCTQQHYHLPKCRSPQCRLSTLPPPTNISSTAPRHPPIPPTTPTTHLQHALVSIMMQAHIDLVRDVVQGVPHRHHGLKQVVPQLEGVGGHSSSGPGIQLPAGDMGGWVWRARLAGSIQT
jgi:hypothetical protein